MLQDYKNTIKRIVPMLLILTTIVTASNITVTANFNYGDGTGNYFCNPCYYTITNDSTTDRSGRTVFGATTQSFSIRNNTNYVFRFKAELIGFNTTEQLVFRNSLDADETLEINISEIYDNQGKLAMVSYDTQNNWYSAYGTFESNQKTLYNISMFTNITKALGFQSLNAYTGGANYSTTSNPTINAFNQYDVVIVTPSNVDGTTGLISAPMQDALETAINSGVKVFIPARQTAQIYPSYIQNSGFLLATVTNVRSHTYFIKDNATTYPQGYTIRDSKYYDGYTQNTHAGATTYHGNVSKSKFGTANTILIQYKVNKTTASPTVENNVSAFVYSVIGNNLFIVPEFTTWKQATSSYVDAVTPIHKALMYGVLTNYSNTNTERYSVTVSAYESACGYGFSPVNDVSCLISGKPCTTTGTQTFYSSINTTLKSGVTINLWSSYGEDYAQPQKDVTHNLLYGHQENKDWFAVWNELFSNSGVRNTWIIGTPETPTSFTNQINRNYTSMIAYMNAVNYYPTEKQYLIGKNRIYISKDGVANVTFNSTVSEWFYNGFHNYYIAGTKIHNPVPSQDYSCEGAIGSQWNITYYSGYNTSHFIKHTLMCYNGQHRKTTETLVTSLPVNSTSDVWNTEGEMYGFSSMFAPVSIIQQGDGTILVERTYLIEVDVTGDGNFQHQIGIMETNLTISYRAIKETPSNCTVSLYSGTHEYTCFPPPNYVFSSNSETTESANFSLGADKRIILSMYKKRPLNIRLQVYDYIDDTLVFLEGVKCNSEFYSTISDEDGYCWLRNVLPETEYDVIIENPKSTLPPINITVASGNYYDTSNIDSNDEMCADFDGNFTYQIYIGAGDIEVFMTPLIKCGNAEYKKANVIIEVDDYNSCVTDIETGTCTVIDLTRKYGATYTILANNTHNAEYEIQPKTFETSITRTNYSEPQMIYCKMDDTCSMHFYVSLLNASDIDCNADEFAKIDEPRARSGDFMTGLFNLISNILEPENRSIIGFFVVAGIGVLTFAMAKNAGITFIAMVMTTFAISDLVFGRGNGFMRSEFVLLIIFILAVLFGLMMMKVLPFLESGD